MLKGWGAGKANIGARGVNTPKLITLAIIVAIVTLALLLHEKSNQYLEALSMILMGILGYAGLRFIHLCPTEHGAGGNRVENP